MRFSLDHIVVAAPDLAVGVAHVRDQIGVVMPRGGEHPLMGTHNHLMRLGLDEFLEVIAVNPDAPAPARARWFGLDHEVPAPRLSHWVLRCDDIGAVPQDLFQITGPAIPVTRGNLAWQLTVPEDGHLPMQGAFPSLIEWQKGPLPPRAMQAADMPGGAGLVGLTIRHPKAGQIADMLTPHLDDPRIGFETGALSITARIAIGGRVVTLG